MEIAERVCKLEMLPRRGDERLELNRREAVGFERFVINFFTLARQGMGVDLNELALFAGAGGGILGGKLLGWRTVCAVEYNPYAASVLAARQNDGLLEAFPIWDDVCTFDGKPWRGIVDVVSGGFPCQDISVAGNGAGLDGERSGLWLEMARIIGEVRPCFAFVENSPALTIRGLGRVLGDLAEMGYDAEWGVLGAVDVGAPHQRDRCWLVAYLPSVYAQGQSDGQRQEQPWRSCRWPTESGLDRVAYGVADRVDRLTAIGNGQVPICAAEAWTRLLARKNL